MKEKIAKWHKQGLWTTSMVRNAVGKVLAGVLFTVEDFKGITGEDYE